MRKSFLAATMGLYIMVLLGGPQQSLALTVTPLFTYTGDALPSEDGWTIIAYPAYEESGARVEDGLLHFTDSNTYGGSAIHYARPWDVDPEGLNIAEFDIKGISCGGTGPNPGDDCIYFGTSDGNGNMIYTVYTDRISSAYMVNGHYGPDTYGESYVFDTTQAFNTYKAAIVDGRARLYINDLLVMDQPAGSGIYNVKGVEFGAGSSAAFGEAYFDEVRAYRIPRSEWESCIQPPSGMIGWWHGDGNADDIIGGNNGTLHGGAAFASGVVGQAFRFTADNDRVELGNPTALHLSGKDFTVDAWVNYDLEDLNTDGAIVSKMEDSQAANGDGWMLLRQEDNHFWFCFGAAPNNGCTSTAATTVRSTTIAAQGTWYHVAGVKNGTEFAIYVNGVKEASKKLPDELYDSDRYPAFIGDSRLRHQLLGLIDEVEVFGRALTTEEIRAIYLAGSAGKCKPNLPPLADAGPDQTLEMTSCEGTSVLDGSGSSDPDNDPLTYTWTENGTIIATGVNPTVILSYGSHAITLTVDDGKGGTASDEIVINVVDTTAPALNVSLNPSTLWPPNHKYVKVKPIITVIDACVVTTTVTLVSATSNEPDNGLGDGDTANDIVTNADGTISLRAERSGKGSGRVYTITYQATDAAGNSTSASATVTAPHNK